MSSLNEAEAAVPLNRPRNKPPNAVINLLNKIDNFNVEARLVQIYTIYERQYKTSELLVPTFYEFMYLILTTLTLNLHITPRILYLKDYNSFNMIIASFFGRKLALNIPKYEEREGIQEEYDEIDLLLECDYPLHTALVICHVSHTMRNAFIREGSGLEFQIKKYEELKTYYQEIACDIVNILYYQDEQGRRKMLTALQSTYNHPRCANNKFGMVIETMAVAFKAEAMKFLSQKPCLFLMDFRHQPRKYLRYGFPLLKIKLWIHAVFRVIYILMFAYMLCRSPIYSDYDNDSGYDSFKKRHWIEVFPSFYVISVLSTQFFVNVFEVSEMMWKAVQMRERNNWFHTFCASVKRLYEEKRLSVWRTILITFVFSLEAIRFVLSVLSRKNVQKTSYTGVWVFVPILLELVYYLLFMLTTISSLRFLSSFKSLGFFSHFIRNMFKTVSMFVFIFCAFWFVLAVTHVGLTRSFITTENTFVYTITSIGKFEIFGNVEDLDRTGNLPDCSNYTRTIHHIFSMDHAEASCLFRSTLLPFLVFAYVFVSAVLLVNLLTAQLSKEYDDEYENCRYYHGYLKYGELSKIEAKLLLPPPLSIIYALLHVLLFILGYVFQLLKLMRIGGWCDCCYGFLRKNTVKRMKGDPYQTLFKMIVTWGKPLQVSGSTVLDMTWEDCLQKCWSDAKCVLIHDTTPTCTYYTISQVFTVEKLSAISASRVAFRVLSDEITCSDPALEPMLVSGTVQSEAEIDNQNVPYNVTLENDVWTFLSNLTMVCQTNSKLFTRGTVPVCMTVVQSSMCLNRLEAAASCGSFGISDTLMGIASLDEFEYVKSTAISFLTNQTTPVNYMRLGVWIDGSRKDLCKRPASKSPNCNGNNEYFYSDPYAQNPAFLWRPNQPDGLTIGDADSDCLFFRVSKEANDVAGVGDMPCASPTYPSLDLCYVGYLCGSYPNYTVS